MSHWAVNDQSLGGERWKDGHLWTAKWSSVNGKMYICGRPHISRFPHHTNWKYPLTHFQILTRYRLQQAPRGNTLGACSNESSIHFSLTLVPMNRIAFNMGNQEWAV